MNSLLASSTYANGKVIVRFRAGETFNYDAATNNPPAILAGPSHLIFDWYNFSEAGGSKRPIFKDTTASTADRTFFKTNTGTNYLTIRHIDFTDVTARTADRKYAANAVTLLGGSNITLRDCKFNNVGNGIDTNQLYAAHGALVQRTTTLNKDSLRNNLVLFRGTHLVVQKNTSLGSTDEHGVRVMNEVDVLPNGSLRTASLTKFIQVAKNEFTVVPGSKKNSVTPRYGSHVYIWDNTLKGGVLYVGDSNNPNEVPADSPSPGYANWVVVRSNRHTHTFEGKYAVGVDRDAKNVLLAQNTYTINTLDSGAIDLSGTSASTNVVISGNSATNTVSASNSNSFLRVSSSMSGVVIKNNIYTVQNRSAWKGFNVYMLKGMDVNGILSSNSGSNVWAYGTYSGAINRLHNSLNTDIKGNVLWNRVYGVTQWSGDSVAS